MFTGRCSIISNGSWVTARSSGSWRSTAHRSSAQSSRAHVIWVRSRGRTRFPIVPPASELRPPETRATRGGMARREGSSLNLLNRLIVSESHCNEANGKLRFRKYRSWVHQNDTQKIKDLQGLAWMGELKL